MERTAELAEANEMMALEIGERQRVETELRDAHERYRKLVEDVPAVVYIWHVGPTASTDPRAYTSPRVEHMLGYTPEEWEQPTLREERVHPHDRERVLAAARRSETTGEPFEQEYRILAKDGRLVWVLDLRHVAHARSPRRAGAVPRGPAGHHLAQGRRAEGAARRKSALRTLAATDPAASYALRAGVGRTRAGRPIDLHEPPHLEAVGTQHHANGPTGHGSFCRSSIPTIASGLRRRSRSSGGPARTTTGICGS